MHPQELGFFMVWNPAGRAPTYRHGRLGEAHAEAERLARLNPGQQFFVLAALGYARTTDVQYVALDHADEIPF